MSENKMKEHKYCKYCPYYAYDIKEDGCLGCIGNVCQYSGDKCPTCCYEPLENEDNLCEVNNGIFCLEEHNEIHSRQEPRAYYTTKALNIAIDFLKNHRWRYPSKGELPKDDRLVVIYYKGGVVDFGSYTKCLNGWHNKFGNSISEPYMWISLEPPKEM